MAAIPVKIYESATLSVDIENSHTLPSGIDRVDSGATTRSGEIASEVLRANLNSFLSNIGEALTCPVRGYNIEEITLSLDISSRGEVRLLITDGNLEAKGNMRLTLKRVSGPVP